MSGPEIRQLIHDAQARINEIQMQPETMTTFVLNPEIGNLKKVISQLKEMCPHKFVKGECMYCGTKKESK